MPAPSPQAVPSAAPANAFTRASGASPRWRLKSTNADADPSTVTPPARAREQSPSRRAWQARCRETREEEQAVSTETAGPSSPST